MQNYAAFINSFANRIRLYDQTVANEILIAYTYNKELESGKYLSGNPDLSDFRANERYNNIIKRIITSDPKEFFIQDFENMNEDDVLSYTYYILNKIFGESKQVLDNYIEFIHYIVCSGDNAPMNGYCYQTTNTNDNSKKYQVVIPTISNISSITCIIHEFIHYYFQKNNILYKKPYYEEILSILFEKIASDMIENDLSAKKFSHKIENIRLDCIKFHYTTRKDDITTFNKIMNQQFISQKDYIQKLVDDYNKYCTKIAQSYGLGYIYAESLYVLYKTDFNAFQKKIREIFNCDTTLQDALDYFNINTSNKEVFEKAKQKIKTVTKK